MSEIVPLQQTVEMLRFKKITLILLKNDIRSNLSAIYEKIDKQIFIKQNSENQFIFEGSYGSER